MTKRVNLGMVGCCFIALQGSFFYHSIGTGTMFFLEAMVLGFLQFP
jgi:hypothetical protein